MKAVRYIQITGALAVATFTFYAAKASAGGCSHNGPMSLWDTGVCCTIPIESIGGCGDGDFFGAGDKYIKAYQSPTTSSHLTIGVGMRNDLTVVCAHQTNGATGSTLCPSDAVRVGVRILHL
jgi:hypothetical protein